MGYIITSELHKDIFELFQKKKGYIFAWLDF